MNKRFLLALALIAAVFIVTPILFPGPPRALATAPIDSSAVPASRVLPEAPAPTALTGSVSTSKPAERDSAARAETTTVATPRARFRLSSTGGSLIGAELSGFRTLDADSLPVELAPRGDALLRFRIRAGADTIALDRAPLVVERAPNGTDVTFHGTARGVPVDVSWSFAPDTYQVHMRGTTENVGYVARVTVRAAGVGPNTFLLVDLPPAIRSSEADTVDDFRHLAYAYKPENGRADLVRFGKPDPGVRSIHAGPLRWAVAKSKYFLVGVLAVGDSRLAELQVTGGVKTGKVTSRGEATAILPMRAGEASFEAYVGPQEFMRLKGMGREFESSNPYGGWMQGLIQPFATIVIRVLLWMHGVLQLNYGWTLIIFGVLIRVILWPLNQMAMRSSLKMQRIQPELAEVQKKYAADRERLNKEIMRVYAEHGMSPFSTLSGCLPMLIPMPVLFALFFVFQNTIEFRGVSFWWMADISRHDPLYILPIVMGASMFVLSWLGIRNSPPNPQARMMMFFMPAMMMVVLFRFAAGLNLYYAAQNLAAIPQQWLIANERAKANTKPKPG